jgi:SHS family lactate transporter-like MFS transporter
LPACNGGTTIAILKELRGLTGPQRSVVAASFLGWTLDAFDFFIMVMVLGNVAADFHTKVSDVALASALTLFMRPVGAFIFGYIADRFGRRPTLMIDIMLYSVLELASAFAPNLITLLVLRALFGIAMGGEWGVGSSLVMESIPPKTRGAVSGFLQEGYAFGYILAAIAYWAVFTYMPQYGWRAMFVIGTIPALLVVYIRMNVKESPAWEAREHAPSGMWRSIVVNWKLVLYVVLMMSCFNAFSHGTQDLYPTFLKAQHHFDPATVSTLTIIANLGAIIGGLSFGVLSENIGRRRAIVLAVLLCLPIIPIWAFSNSLLWLAVGAFLMQISVQGAWGIIPAHLNELSPDAVRGTFPGFTYSLGNAVISLLGPYQAWLAESRDNDYGFALAVVAAVVAISIAVVVGFGVEKKGVAMGTADV